MSNLLEGPWLPVTGGRIRMVRGPGRGELALIEYEDPDAERAVVLTLMEVQQMLWMAESFWRLESAFHMEASRP